MVFFQAVFSTEIIFFGVMIVDSVVEDGSGDFGDFVVFGFDKIADSDEMI